MREQLPVEPSQVDPAAILPDRPLSLVGGGWRRALAGTALAAAGPGAVTFALLSVDVPEAFKIAGLVYLIPVMISAAVSGMTAATVTSLLSFAALDYYFTTPVREFGVPGKTEDLIALAVFLIVAFGVARTLARERTDRVSSGVARRRLAFLAGANELLQRASLDFERTMSELARLSVPGIADWCTIDVRRRDGRLHTIAVAYGDRVRVALAENLAHQNQPRPDASKGIAAVVRTGQPELYPVVDEEVLHEVARDGQHAALLRGLELKSLLIVPLLVRGVPIGAVKFASVRPDRRYGPEDLTLAEDLALRAGTALENVQLYEERTRAARTLQRSLLPASIPAVPGLEIEERFEPFGEGDLVGGDFYDVFQGAQGRWMFVVGDVCGKGSEAAALTGLARHTIRAVAMRDASPAAVLRGLNEAIIRANANSFCTVALASYEPSATGGTLRLARGGHPAPVLLRAGGDASLTGKPGSLLGVFEDAAITDESIELGEGDAMVFYTDGVLDERTPDPERALLDIIRGCRGCEAKRIADRVAEAAPEHGKPPEDDRAVLVVRVTPDGDGGSISQRWT